MQAHPILTTSFVSCGSATKCTADLPSAGSAWVGSLPLVPSGDKRGLAEPVASAPFPRHRQAINKDPLSPLADPLSHQRSSSNSISRSIIIHRHECVEKVAHIAETSRRCTEKKFCHDTSKNGHGREA